VCLTWGLALPGWPCSTRHGIENDKRATATSIKDANRGTELINKIALWHTEPADDSCSRHVRFGNLSVLYEPHITHGAFDHLGDGERTRRPSMAAKGRYPENLAYL
jgi:hypothetical protein